MPIASQANSHAIGSIGVRILCSDVTILFVIRMRSPIPAFRHPPNLRSPESSLTLVVQRKLYHIRTLLPRKLYHRVHGAKVFNFSKSVSPFYNRHPHLNINTGVLTTENIHRDLQ